MASEIMQKTSNDVLQEKQFHTEIECAGETISPLAEEWEEPDPKLNWQIALAFLVRTSSSTKNHKIDEYRP